MRDARHIRSGVRAFDGGAFDVSAFGGRAYSVLAGSEPPGTFAGRGRRSHLGIFSGGADR
jgi:hypothetical protein